MNAKSESESCHISNKGESDTQDFKQVEFAYDHLNLVGIDTPGLEDFTNNDSKINQIKTLLIKNLFIRKIIFIKPYSEVRILKCYQVALKVFMETFPLKNFWEHVIIVDTRAVPTDDTFQDFLEEGPPSFNDNLLKNKNMIEIKKQKNIDAPNKIEEFFVDSKRYKKYPDIGKKFNQI